MKHLYLVLILLNGCTTHVVTSPTVLPPVTAPTPAPLNLNTVQWKILTVQDMKDILATLSKDSSKQVILYTLDEGNYRAFDANLNDIQRYILEQKEVILFYKQLEAGKTTNQSNGQQ